MLLIINENTDAYFNMALEEYLLSNMTQDIFMLWRNKSAIVIGKNQNAIAEIEENIVRDKDIQLVRRLSGGGAVYHDLGNINYTYIMRKSSEHFNDYKYFAQPICRMLNGLGVNAELSGRNDIITQGKKISGTAQAKNGEDVLFHGTLLIDSDLSLLASCLRPDKSKLKRHGIASVEGRVSNLKSFLPKGTTVENVIAHLAREVKKERGATEYSLTTEDIAKVEELANNKYRTREWNYGFTWGEDEKE